MPQWNRLIIAAINMIGMKYNDEGIAELREALKQQGVALPEKIERIAGGAWGLCLIGNSEVLKLFGYDPKIIKSGFNKAFFDNSVVAYLRLSEVASEITKRGVSVPELTDYTSVRLRTKDSSNKVFSTIG